MTPGIQRKIIHVDMDAFYASVEQLDNPALRNKPIAVGGSGARGVIATASYEARKYGVHSAMPGYLAKKKCPNLIFVPPRFVRYKEISSQVRDIFFMHTDLVEPLSLDEAYLDVTENKLEISSAIKIAQLIREAIMDTTGLTASAGVSINKFLAKVASDLHKPDGLSVLLPDDVQTFVDELPIRKFYGVGKAMQRKMSALNIHNGYDLRQYSEIELVQHFGKMGRYLYQVSRGQDDRKVNAERIRKSISVERTYSQDLLSIEAVNQNLDKLSRMLEKDLTKKNIKGRTVNLKVRYSDFTTLTRSRTFSSFISDVHTIKETVRELYDKMEITEPQIRLLGLGLSNLDSEYQETQLHLDF